MCRYPTAVAEDGEVQAFETNFADHDEGEQDGGGGGGGGEEAVAAPAEALAAFDRRDAEKSGGASGALSLDALRVAISDVVGLNGGSASAVGEALENAFSDIDQDFTGLLPRRLLGVLLQKFDAEVAAAAAAGRTLVPPAAVPPMSKPQADAITGVFTSTCKPGSQGMTRGEFLELISAAGLCGDGQAQTPEVAVDVTFCRCVSGRARGEMDFRSFVMALAALAGERSATFFQVAAPVVDAAMQLQARRASTTTKGGDEEEGAGGGGGGSSGGGGGGDEGGFEANFDNAPPPAAAPPPATAPAAAPAASSSSEKQGQEEELSADERAVWNQEFSSYDEDGSGMIDIECLSFALAKLRLLEDVDVEQAAADLESKLVEVDTDCTGEFTFEDFVVFGCSLRALKRSSGVKPSAKPVAVQREYVFNEAGRVRFEIRWTLRLDKGTWFDFEHVRTRRFI